MSDKMQTLGKYQLLEKIGEGGFGVVYRARDPLLEREVAIKVLRADLASAPDFVERFRREARLAASLRHPNIVTVIEVGEQDGRYYLVMDDLPGGTLQNVLEPGKPLAISRVVELLQPLAEALDYAHVRHVVHRDIKPTNILFSSDGEPVITDFGLVKSTAQDGLTTTGTVMGTADYMAPEQIQGMEITAAVDRYAFGVVAYQMLAGQVPFRGNTPFEIQTGHVQREPPDPREFNPGLPEEIVSALKKILSKKPEERFATLRQFLKELDKIANRLTQQQLQQWVMEGKNFMKRREFDQAIEKFEQAQTIQLSEEIETMLEECRRRKSVTEEYQGMKLEYETIDRRIKALLEEESWLSANTFSNSFERQPPLHASNQPSESKATRPEFFEPAFSRERPMAERYQWQTKEDKGLPKQPYRYPAGDSRSGFFATIKEWIRDNQGILWVVGIVIIDYYNYCQRDEFQLR